MIFKLLINLVSIKGAEDEELSLAYKYLGALVNKKSIEEDERVQFMFGLLNGTCRMLCFRDKNNINHKNIKDRLKEKYNYDLKVDETSFYYNYAVLSKVQNELFRIGRWYLSILYLIKELQSLIEEIKKEHFKTNKEFYKNIEPVFDPNISYSDHTSNKGAYNCAIELLIQYDKSLSRFEDIFYDEQNRVFRKLIESNDRLSTYLLQIERYLFENDLDTAFKKKYVPKEIYRLINVENNRDGLKPPNIVFFYFLKKSVVEDWKLYIDNHKIINNINTLRRKYGIRTKESDRNIESPYFKLSEQISTIDKVQKGELIGNVESSMCEFFAAAMIEDGKVVKDKKEPVQSMENPRTNS